nr:FANTASTIC FOUR-like protein [Ginkgo biloba]
MMNFCKSVQTYLGLWEVNQKTRYGANYIDHGANGASLGRNSSGDMTLWSSPAGSARRHADSGDQLSCFSEIFGELDFSVGLSKSSSGLGLVTAEREEPPNVLRAASVVEKPIILVEKMNAADDIVSVGGEDCSEKVKEYDDLWSLCQPKNQPFDSSLLGSVPASHVPCRVVERSAPAQSWRSNGAPKYKDGLQFCTESLGFESSDEREDCSTDPTTFHSAYSSIANTEEKALENDRNDGEGERYVSDDTEVGEEFREKQRYFHGGGRGSVTKRCSRATPATFPPPLSSMDPNGHPHVFLKPLRRDGRFLLQEVKVVRNEVLRAWRQDGRLRLQLVRHDDDKQQRCSHLQDDNDGTPTDNEIMDSTQLGEEMVSLTDLTADDDAASDDGDSHVGLECRGDFSREWGAERWNKAGEGQDVHVDSLLQSSGRRSVMDTSLPVFPLKNEGYGRCQEKSKCMSMWEPGIKI